MASGMDTWVALSRRTGYRSDDISLQGEDCQRSRALPLVQDECVVNASPVFHCPSLISISAFLTKTLVGQASAQRSAARVSTTRACPCRRSLPAPPSFPPVVMGGVTRMSTRRYLPPMGAAGLARNFVSGQSWEPRLPPSTTPRMLSRFVYRRLPMRGLLDASIV
jgi:NAD-dependent dihydropyrimidine dehydrogenase PreA subunit